MSPVFIARRRRRRGLVSVVALIALMVIVMVCAGLLKVAFARRSALRSEERRIQAGLLADSGLDRARSRLAASTDYPGETWEIRTEDLGGRGPGTVLIEVEKLADSPDRRQVRVHAEFPARSPLKSRVSRESLIPIVLPAR